MCSTLFKSALLVDGDYIGLIVSQIYSVVQPLNRDSKVSKQLFIFFFKVLCHQTVSHTKLIQRDLRWNNVYPSCKHIGKSTKDKPEWTLSAQSCKPAFIEAWSLELGSITGRARLPARFPPVFALLWPPWRKQLHPTRSYSQPTGEVLTCHSWEALPKLLALPVLSENEFYGEASSFPNCRRLPNLGQM